jgi:hypothetical protein
MIVAAVYCRKGTDQTGVADDQKSVARQVEHAHQYAASKGWRVDEASVFVDDGISGAEFANGPARQARNQGSNNSGPRARPIGLWAVRAFQARAKLDGC